MENEDALAVLSALAQETRLGIFRLLVETGTQGRAVGSIGEALGLPSATLSFHLKELKNAGLVAVRRESRSLIYSANFATMNDLIAFLTRNCCGGDVTACDPTGIPVRRETT